jgi:hypothetical protein
MPVADGGGVIVLPDGSYAQQVVIAPPLDVILLPSAARTAQASTADFINPGSRGIYVWLNVTAASGTGGLQVKVQAKDPASGAYSSLHASPTAIIATGQNIYVLYPSGTVITGTSTSYNAVLPRTWRVTVLVGDASSYTYSVGASLLP